VSLPRPASALLLVLAMSALAAPPTRAAIPDNDGWVTDRAGFLTGPQEQALESLMESYKAGSTNEIALLTVPSLEGEPIERFSLEVARAWKMGTKERSNAALLVVSRDDRQIRIEVGRGLEGNLTDSICGRIIRDVIVPGMRDGQPYEALRDGIVAIHAAAGGDYGKIPRGGAASGRSSGLLGLLPLLFFLLVFGRRGFLPYLLLGGFGRRYGGFGGGFGGFGGGGFGGFGGGGGFSGGGASGRW
jgi:uncharacterized protein